MNEGPEEWKGRGARERVSLMEFLSYPMGWVGSMPPNDAIMNLSMINFDINISHSIQFHLNQRQITELPAAEMDRGSLSQERERERGSLQEVVGRLSLL